MEYPKTRKEAKDSGSKYYFTGEPCKHGHIALRKTKGACVECLKKEWREPNEKRKAYRAEYNKSEAAQRSKRKYYEANKELVIARAQARTTEDKNRYKQKYKSQNPELYKALNSVRKRRHREATPSWVTAEQKLQMRRLYLQAQQMTKITGERYVVDHITPLISPEVCGLHVPWNLRVITQEENLKKSNKIEHSL
jgi:hypothetical protein